MARRVTVEREIETDAGWRFEVLIAPPPGKAPVEPSHHIVTLSWADYDLWCGGLDRPETIARRVVEFLLDRDHPAIPPHFDAATLRRWYPTADADLTNPRTRPE